ncbi:MAG: copper resistance CopC/CopD family protein [Solirubrobacteraceae bacterium]
MSTALATRARPTRPRHTVLLSALLALTLLATLASAPSAFAHAELLATSPDAGATVPRQPPEVIFKFNEAVGGTLGAVRVYDANGRQVDNLDVSHPHGHQHWMGVGLKPGLPDGTYTATYRVVSADTHIVYGGLVFNIGHAGAAPRITVAGLIRHDQAGAVTKLAFDIVRGLDYASIALAIGGLGFLLIAWLPALAALAREEPRWSLAAKAFNRRMTVLLALAVLLGVLVSVLGVLLQGATAGGVSLWSSLKLAIAEDTLESRFGEVWGLRALDWLALGALLVGVRRRVAHARGVGWLLVPLAPCIAYLALTPALAGHASTESPVGVFFPSDVLHVLAASVWVGGIACLLLALPTGTRQLEGPDRSRLLLAALARFSPLALAAVLALALTGVLQAYIDVRSLHALLHTTYGVLILAKTALLVALLGLGWVNRGRILPGLHRVVASGEAPGATGVLARRTLRGELALMGCVLGVTAVLIGYTPPIDMDSGPFSIDTTIGPAVLEMTVEPARVGLNTIHLYLFDAKSGAQFAGTREITVTATLPSKGIGPLPLKANVSGPGHYTLNGTALSPGGTWTIELVDRVSEFEEFTRKVKVPIR